MSCLAPYIFPLVWAEAKENTSLAAPPTRGSQSEGLYTIRVWKIFHLTSSPLPQSRESMGGEGELSSAGSRDRGSKVWKQDGFPPQGAHNLW